MSKKINLEQLIVPVYINEKIVLDMLAIIEDGFSMVSQVEDFEQSDNNRIHSAGGEVSTPILSKLLKINLKGSLSNEKNKRQSKNVSSEKIHTNVSLLSKFRTLLEEENLLVKAFDFTEVEIGSFVEIEGELQKNPLIDYVEKIKEMMELADIFSEAPALGNKTAAAAQKKKEQELVKQIKEFSENLKTSGTVDFVLSNNNDTVILSAQEQYLENDNVSELIGGRFKVLGKVISICKENSSSIDLLRKTTLSVLSDDMLEDIFKCFKDEALQMFNLPELKTKIEGPAIMVIPIAIYA